MQHHLIPFQGSQEIRFGDRRADIRSRFGDNFQEFKRNPFAENTTDQNPEWGIFVEYNQDNKCEALEFSSDAAIFFKGLEIMKMNFDKLRKKFDPISEKMEEEADFSVTYYDLGFGMTRNFETDRVDSFILFSKDYW